MLKLLKEQKKYSWRKARPNDAYVNTSENINLRQIFADKFIEIIKKNYVILNFDESVINSSCGIRKSWHKKGSGSQRFYNKSVSNLSIMLTTSSMGHLFFQFLDGNNNETSVANYFIDLESELTKINQDWRDSHILLMDNCSSHQTPTVRNILKSLGFTVVFSAPASYDVMPVERFFFSIKRKDFQDVETPNPSAVKSDNIEKFTLKQKMMIKISKHLRALTKEKMAELYMKSFLQLEHLLLKKSV